MNFYGFSADLSHNFKREKLKYLATGRKVERRVGENIPDWLLVFDKVNQRDNYIDEKRKVKS